MSIIELADAEVVEGGNLVFNVTLSQPSLADVTVDYRLVADGSASLANFTDINVSNTAATRTLTIPAGETSAQITFATRSENNDEADENITLELSDPANATLSGGEATLTATGIILDNDGGQDRALFVSDPRVIEGNGGTKQAVFEVRISEPSGSTIQLPFTTVDGTAKAGEDYVATSGSVTFLAGQTVTSVAVDIIGDTVVETPEQFSLVVTPTLAIADGLLDAVGVGTILADDGLTPQPVISVDATRVDEGGNLVFSVVLSETSLADISVQFRLVADGSASLANFTDINVSNTASLRTLTIPAGTLTTEITYATRIENNDETDENITLELSDPVNATLAGGEPVLLTTGVILDDEGGQDRALFVSDPRLVEGDTGNKQAVFEIRLSEPSANAITLPYKTVDGNAIAGQDYVSKTGSVTFAAGQTVAAVAVDVIGDTLNETNEQFALVVTPNLAIASGVDDVAGVATILADDGPTSQPVISITPTAADEGGVLVWNVTLSETSLADIFVNFRLEADGAATLAGFTDINVSNAHTERQLIIPAGETSAQISYATRIENNDERDENITIVLSEPVNATLSGGEETLSAVGLIFDDDGGQDRALFVSDPKIIEGDTGSKLAVFEVRISEPSATEIVLPFETTDGSAIAGQDYVAKSGNVTFAPGQTAAFVTVAVLGDTLIETPEQFSLVVTPTLAIAGGVADAAGIATILADDAAAALPVVSVTPAIVDESGVLVFNVSLSEPTLDTVTLSFRLVADGTIDISSFDDINVSGVSNTFQLEIPPGQTNAQINYTTRTENNDEFDENVTLELSNPINATLAGGESTLTTTGVVLDDEGGQDRALFVSDPKLIEGDAGTKQAVFEIRISEPAAFEIALSYTTVNGTATAGSDYIAKSGTVTFLPGQTVATVAVDVIGDSLLTGGDVESNETFSLIVAPNVAIFNGTDDNAGVATILNDDFATLGTNGNETIVGSVGDDVILGLAGNDRLDGLSGNDVLFGGTGNDILVGRDGNDAFYGGLGADVMFGSGGADRVLYSQSTSGLIVDLILTNRNTGEAAGDQYNSIELLFGSRFNDELRGTNTNNVIAGENGNDRLYGRGGNDDIFGGNGNDQLDGGVGADDLFGGAGVDRVLYNTASAGVVADLILSGRNTGDAAGDTYSSIELVFGSGFTDELRGTQTNNVIVGNAGNDRLYGRGGNDDIYGGAGNDQLDGGTGGDDLFGGSGFDRVLYNTASAGVTADLILSGRNTGDAAGDTYSSIEFVFGSAFTDELRGTQTNNLLVGNGGNDRLYGRGGNDDIFGGAGNDQLDGGAGADDLFGGSGIDRVLYNTASAGVVVDLILNNRNTGDAAGDTYSSIELVYGSGFADELRGTQTNNLLVGNGGNDLLYGRGGNDDIYAGAGNDFIDGGDGADELFGGAGADSFILRAGDGTDIIYDFADNVDTLRFDDALWNGTLTNQQIISNFATLSGGNAVFAFDDGTQVTVNGVTNLNLLVDDIAFF